MWNPRNGVWVQWNETVISCQRHLVAGQRVPREWRHFHFLVEFFPSLQQKEPFVYPRVIQRVREAAWHHRGNDTRVDHLCIDAMPSVNIALRLLAFNDIFVWQKGNMKNKKKKKRNQAKDTGSECPSSSRISHTKKRKFLHGSPSHVDSRNWNLSKIGWKLIY